MTDLSLFPGIELFVPVLLVATLYASVGHGGASGYLAVLSFFVIAPDEMASTALILNVLVATMAFLFYLRAGYFSLSLSLPLVLVSVPAAFIGGRFHVAEKTYLIVLACMLTLAAVRLALPSPRTPADDVDVSSPQLTRMLPLSAGIGLLSGMVGVGGGIFLSPVMLLLKWADFRTTAATSAFFIIVNSLAGIAGRASRGGFESGSVGFLIIAGLAGSLIGGYFGAHRLPVAALRKILALVLLIAAFKMILKVL